jgi:cytoskeletal protein CcmA (bactofilin family)
LTPKPSPPRSRSRQSAFHSGRASTLGATLRIKGDLVADEDLVIQGQVEGSILHTRSLTIGSQGKVRGDIRARRIVVEGTVEGNLYALESVSLRPGATVRGDVFASGVAMDEGARLIGRIDMDNAPTVPTVRVPVTDSMLPVGGDLSDTQADALLTGS